MDEARFSALEARVSALEHAPVEWVWVVMYDHVPYAVVRSEEEAERIVVSLLKPGLYRAIGSGCWFKMPVSGG